MTEPELEGGFSRRTLGWIIGCAVASCVAAVLFSVYGRDLELHPKPGANTFSYSALGHRALAELLQSMGLGVISRQSSARGAVGPKQPLILAEPDATEIERQKIRREEAEAAGAAVVIVIPKWEVGPAEEGKPEWLARVRQLSLPEIESFLRSIGVQRVAVQRAREGPSRCSAAWRGAPAELRIEARSVDLLSEDADLEPVVRCDGGLLIARLVSDRSTYLIADPDILNNQGLGRGDNALTIYGFLAQRLGATGVVFDETTHGFQRDQGLLAEALRFPMVLGTLHGLLLLGIVLWAGMGRFGKPLPASLGLAAGKAVLIDNTAKLLTDGRHAGDSLLRYFRQTTRAVAAHYFLPPDLPDEERLAQLQRLTGERRGRLNLRELEQRIRGLPADRRGEERAARLARRLYRWRLEMMNGDRKGS